MTHLNKWQFKIILNAKASQNNLISKIHLHTLAQKLVYQILNRTSEHLKQMFHLNPISNLMIKVINSQVIITFDTDFLLTYQQTD